MAQAIKELVAEKLGKSGEVAQQFIVDLLVSEEQEKRSKAAIAVFRALEEAKSALLKFKPDMVSYSDDGKVTQESWSKQKVDEKIKATKRVADLEDMLMKALDQNNFDKVLEEAKRSNKTSSPE